MPWRFENQNSPSSRDGMRAWCPGVPRLVVVAHRGLRLPQARCITNTNRSSSIAFHLNEVATRRVNPQPGKSTLIATKVPEPHPAFLGLLAKRCISSPASQTAGQHTAVGESGLLRTGHVVAVWSPVTAFARVSRSLYKGPSVPYSMTSSGDGAPASSQTPHLFLHTFLLLPPVRHQPGTATRDLHPSSAQAPKPSPCGIISYHDGEAKSAIIARSPWTVILFSIACVYSGNPSYSTYLCLSLLVNAARCPFHRLLHLQTRNIFPLTHTIKQNRRAAQFSFTEGSIGDLPSSCLDHLFASLIF
jgi:hypothetical protein